MGEVTLLTVKLYLYGLAARDEFYGVVGAVPLARIRKRAEKHYRKALSTPMLGEKNLHSLGRSHSMGAGGSFTYLINISYSFHTNLTVLYFYYL